MKTKYLLVFACLLMVACDKPVAEKTKDLPTTPPVAEKVVEPAETPAEKPPESPAVAEVAEPKTPAQKFAAIKAKFAAEMSKFQKAYSAASASEKRKVFEESYPKPADYTADVMKIAEDFPEDDVAPEALMWIIQRSRGGAEAATATERMVNNYMDSEKLGALCSTLVYGDMSKKTIATFERIREKSPHDSVKASATFSLAKFYSNIKSSQERILGNEQYEKSSGEETVAFLKEFEFDSMTVESLYQSVIDEFPDMKPNERSKRTFKEMATAALFEMNNLQIGLVAPDIEGEDLDGTKFKLSDYRGKVVILDFWGDW